MIFCHLCVCVCDFGQYAFLLDTRKGMGILFDSKSHAVFPKTSEQSSTQNVASNRTNMLQDS